MHEIALLGAGRIGRIHALNVRLEPRLRLRYVVDPVAAAAEEVAAESGAQVAAFDAAIGDPQVGGIVIASSTDTHLDFSLRALGAGKAVFCEKPIDLDLGRALAAGAQFETASSPFFVGFNRRFDPNFAELHRRLCSGEVGRLETLHIISHDPAPPPVDYVRVSGGLFRDMTIHDFDIARWLLGEEPVEIYAAGSVLVDERIGEAGDIDTAKILLRTKGGQQCFISNTRRSGYGYDQRIEAYCSGGVIRAGNVRASTVETFTEVGSVQPALQNFFLDRYAQAYRAEMAHFADLLDGEPAPKAGYADGVAALRLADAAGRSMLTRSVVRLDS